MALKDAHDASKPKFSEMYDFSILRELRKREDLTIAEVAERSGISPAVISKLERNQTQAELETLFRLSRIFGMNAADLLSLAEAHTGHRTHATSYPSGGFQFQRIIYGNVRCMYGSGKKGSTLSRPEIHQDDYEVCWVLEGSLCICLPNEKHSLETGDALQFDAILPHTYEVVEDCRIIICHITKGKRL